MNRRQLIKLRALGNAVMRWAGQQCSCKRLAVQPSNWSPGRRLRFDTLEADMVEDQAIGNGKAESSKADNGKAKPPRRQGGERRSNPSSESEGSNG